MPCRSPLHKFTAHFHPVKTRRVPVGLPHEYAVESGFSYGILCQTRERHSKNFVLNIIIVSATFGNSRWHELTYPPPVNSNHRHHAGPPILILLTLLLFWLDRPVAGR